MTLVWRHERDILNHAPPTVSVHFWMKRLLYYIQSIRSRKNKPCPLFSSFNIRFLLEVCHNTEVKTVANFRFTRTLSVCPFWWFIISMTFFFVVDSGPQWSKKVPSELAKSLGSHPGDADKQRDKLLQACCCPRPTCRWHFCHADSS